MPAIRVCCPSCAARLEADAQATPREVLCPGCGQPVQLPPSICNGAGWYYARGQQKCGPVSLEGLRYLADQGLLAPADMLIKEGASRWVPASSLPELFPSPEKTHHPLPSDSSEDIFAHQATTDATAVEGPLTMRGMHARPRISLTWGDFQILRKLGAGNMGAVYLARQKSMEREVALKVLFKHLALQARFVERFYREAEAMARLDHPGIVRCYGVGDVKGCPYFAMEFVHGFSAGMVQKEFGGKFRVGDALYLIVRCAEALGHAHERGVVHRDVKPENILLTHLGYVKITDLGLAKPVDEDLSLTDTGVSLGTPYYMAPEQARDAKHADHRSDIYALGCVLYSFLTGRLPFQEGSMMKLLQAKERGAFPRARQLNPEVPERLSLTVDKMLARDPKDRHQTCGEVIRSLSESGLVNPHLSFNVLRVCKALHRADPATDPEPENDRVEVLLIDQNHEDIRHAREALDQSNIFSNLTVVDNGLEALALLRQEGEYARAPRPDLVIIGLDLGRDDIARLLKEFTTDENLRGIPLVVLSWSAASAASLLRARGLAVSLNVLSPDDLERFEGIIRSVRELCVTVVERDPSG